LQVDDEDVTRPATQAPSPVVDRTAALDANAAAAADRADDGGDAAARAAPAALRRLAPEEGEGDVVTLAADDYVLGRSHACNVILLSATASRRHARIVRRNGEWFLCPLGGKAVIVDRRPVYEETPLRHQMKIQLGADEFVFLQEDPGPDEAGQEDETMVTPAARVSPPPAPVPETSRPPAVWMAICVGAVSLAALAFWLLL
jgi:hypothetical protein